MTGFVLDDGGRHDAGFTGTTGDCVTRAVAIATGIPYREVYDRVNALAKAHERRTKAKGISNARTGVYKQTTRRLMDDLGWTWTPTMRVGSGCTVHLRADELPAGRLVVAVSKHIVAVIDGVIHDMDMTVDRDGTRCVYGYWEAPAGTDPATANEATPDERTAT